MSEDVEASQSRMQFLEVKLKPAKIEEAEEANSREDALTEQEPSIVRLTPTGKISHAKTRVYTQRYRKEWECMPDFKDWLTSVPYEATRAYCKFCERNLHAHRLSLLKHMCTLKHQRAAVQFSKSLPLDNSNKTSEDESLGEVKFITENEDEEEGETNYDDTSYVQETDDTIIDDIQEEVVEIETESEIPVFKKIRLQKDNNQDTLAQAIAEADFIDDTEPIQLEMIVETEPDDNEEEDSKSYLISCSNPSKESCNQKESSNRDQNLDENLNSENEDIKTIVPKTMNVTLESDDQNKVYFFSSGGKSYTLVKATNPIVLNQARKIAMQPRFAKNDLKINKEPNVTNVNSVKIPSEAVVQKDPAVLNTASVLKNTLIVKKPFISTNVLDTSKGNPVSGLQVSLYKLQDGRWTFIHESTTSASGNCSDFAESKYNLTTGRFKLHYDTEKYYTCKRISSFYPFIEIVFDIKDPSGTYHFPLLVSPFSYSTYKSSNKTN